MGHNSGGQRPGEVGHLFSPQHSNTAGWWPPRKAIATCRNNDSRGDRGRARVGEREVETWREIGKVIVGETERWKTVAPKKRRDVGMER